MQIVDAAGMVLKASEAKGGGGTFSTIATAEYDPSGRTLKATDRDEVTITTSYDNAKSGTGKPVLVTATTEVSLPTTTPSTQTTNVQPPRYMQYDSAGNLRRQDERASFGGPTWIVWTYDVWTARLRGNSHRRQVEWHAGQEARLARLGICRLGHDLRQPQWLVRDHHASNGHPQKTRKRTPRRRPPATPGTLYETRRSACSPTAPREAFNQQAGADNSRYQYTYDALGRLDLLRPARPPFPEPASTSITTTMPRHGCDSETHQHTMPAPAGSLHDHATPTMPRTAWTYSRKPDRPRNSRPLTSSTGSSARTRTPTSPNTGLGRQLTQVYRYDKPHRATPTAPTASRPPSLHVRGTRRIPQARRP